MALNDGIPEVLENCLKCTITFAACFRYIPPIGRGIIPLAVVFASPVHTTATLLLIQALLIILPPSIFYLYGNVDATRANAYVT